MFFLTTKSREAESTYPCPDGTEMELNGRPGAPHTFADYHVPLRIRAADTPPGHARANVGASAAHHPRRRRTRCSP